MNILGEIKRVLFEDDTQSNQEVARKVAEKCDQENLLRLAIQALAIQVATHRQTELRKAQIAAIPKTQAPVRQTVEGKRNTTEANTIINDVVESDFLTERNDLNLRLICVPKVGYVRFGEMTVTHHELVIDQYAGKIAASNAVIADHRDAISRIEKAGVVCLAEIKEEAVV